MRTDADRLSYFQAGGARPAEARVRAVVERATGADLSEVPVHADTAGAAQALGARAFTVGGSVSLAPAEPGPGTAEGDRLLAHELVHAVQQRATPWAPTAVRPSHPGEPAEIEAEAVAEAALAGRAAAIVQRARPGVVARAPAAVETVETKGIALDATVMADWAKRNYWEQKLFAKFDFFQDPAALARFSASGEEQNAILSLAWDTAAKLTTDTTQSLSVPARAGVKGSKPVLYALKFAPRKVKDRLELYFIGADAAASSVVAAPPAPSFSGGHPAFKPLGFPDIGFATYFAKHPDEEKALWNWITTLAPNPVSQVLKLSETTKAGSHDSFVLVKRDTAAGPTDPELTFMGESAPTTATPPAGYASRDEADRQLEIEQARGTDKLGSVSLPAGIPADEVLPVKFAVYQYFTSNKTRNAEVDAVVPVPGTTPKRVLYTLRFRPKTNDVDVERIGDEAKVGSLDPAKMKLDVARVPDYAAKSGDVKTLSAWVATRYPGVSASGADVAALTADVNKKIEAEADKPAWLKKVYGMDVLDATAGRARLVGHGLAADQLDGNMKSYAGAELRILERALETLSDGLLALVKGVSFVRQAAAIDIEGSGKARKAVRKAKIQGRTFTPSGGGAAGSTVVLFDSLTMSGASLFLGGSFKGAASAAPMSAMTPLHELGHVVGAQAGIQDAFNKKFVGAGKTPLALPVTWYAASKPAKDAFTEAFALYNGDPDWMKANRPDLWAWFETLRTTGKPPP